jgi:dipeptidyl aminopeptidase/acylaminoacyl peptidase
VTIGIRGALQETGADASLCACHGARAGEDGRPVKRFSYLMILAQTALGAPKVAVPNNIVTRGFMGKEFSAERAAQLAPYLNVRPLRFQDWHPTEHAMLITRRPARGQVTQLHVVNKPNGEPVVLTDGAEPVRSAAYHPKDGNRILFLRDAGGSEKYQIFHLDVATKKTTRLTDGKHRHTGARWSPDGRRIAYFSPKRNGRDNDLYTMDPTKPASEKRLATLPGGGWWITDWSPDGRLLLVIEYLSINHSRIHIIDAATGERSLFSPETKAKVSHGLARFDPQMRAVYYTCDESFDFQHIVRVDFKDGRRTRFLTEIRWDVENLEISEDGKTLAVVHNESGVSRLRVVDANTQRVFYSPKLFPGVIHSVSWRADGLLAFDHEWAHAPGEVHVLDLSPVSSVRWQSAGLDGLDPSKLPIPVSGTFTSRDGTKFDAWFYYPGNYFDKGRHAQFSRLQVSGGLPTVIYYHGGPESQFRPRFIGGYNYLPGELNVVLVCPNVRGSRGYGKKFLAADNGAKRVGVMLDVETLRNGLNEMPNIDGNRLAVMGGSYGGYMTLASLTHMPGFFKCGIDRVGISSFVTFLKNTSDYRRDLRRAEYGDERDPKMRKVLEEISPLNQIQKQMKEPDFQFSPLLIVQGANDPRVPATESAQMETALRAKGQTVWYLLAKDEGHGFRKKVNRDFQYLATMEFLRKHLLGKK